MAEDRQDDTPWRAWSMTDTPLTHVGRLEASGQHLRPHATGTTSLRLYLPRRGEHPEGGTGTQSIGNH